MLFRSVHDGNSVNNNDDWDIPLLVEEGNGETGESHEKQQENSEAYVSYEIIESSPSRDDENRLDVTPTLRRSGRKTQLPARYRENAFITSMLSVVEPLVIKKQVNIMNRGKP